MFRNASGVRILWGLAAALVLVVLPLDLAQLQDLAQRRAVEPFDGDLEGVLRVDADKRVDDGLHGRVKRLRPLGSQRPLHEVHAVVDVQPLQLRLDDACAARGEAADHAAIADDPHRVLRRKHLVDVGGELDGLAGLRRHHSWLHSGTPFGRADYCSNIGPSPKLGTTRAGWATLSCAVFTFANGERM